MLAPRPDAVNDNCWVRRPTSEGFRQPGFGRDGRSSAVFALALDLEVGQRLPRDRLDEAAGQLNVGEQGDGEIHRRPADGVVVGQLFFLVVLGDVDHEVDLSRPQVIQDVRLLVGQRPVEELHGDVVIGHEPRRAAGCEEVHPQRLELPGAGQELGLGLDRPGRKKDVLDRQPVAHRQERLEESLLEIVAQAGHLARRGHLDPQRGVGAAQPREGELRRLDADILQVEHGAVVALDRVLHDDPRRDIDE